MDYLQLINKSHYCKIFRLYLGHEGNFLVHYSGCDGSRPMFQTAILADDAASIERVQVDMLSVNGCQ